MHESKVLVIDGRPVQLNAEGFLADPRDWDSGVAIGLAAEEGIKRLGDEHWIVVRFISDYYRQFGLAPSVRKLCVSLDLEAERVFELFPTGPARGACRIAGLPSSDGCV